MTDLKTIARKSIFTSSKKFTAAAVYLSACEATEDERKSFIAAIEETARRNGKLFASLCRDALDAIEWEYPVDLQAERIADAYAEYIL